MPPPPPHPPTVGIKTPSGPSKTPQKDTPRNRSIIAPKGSKCSWTTQTKELKKIKNHTQPLSSPLVAETEGKGEKERERLFNPSLPPGDPPAGIIVESFVHSFAVSVLFSWSCSSSCSTTSQPGAERGEYPSGKGPGALQSPEAGLAEEGRPGKGGRKRVLTGYRHQCCRLSSWPPCQCCC